MFFGSRKRRRHQPTVRASAGSDEASQETQRQTQQLEDWRRSAQKVTRAWNAWLAAEARERSTRYRAYVAASQTKNARPPG
jgi:hypothetical protein